MGKARAIAKDAHGKLCCLLSDASPEVRASILYALGVLLGTSGSMTIDVAHPTAAEQHRRRERTHGTARPPCVCTGALTGLTPVRQRNLEVGIAVAILASGSDCSPTTTAFSCLPRTCITCVNRLCMIAATHPT